MIERALSIRERSSSALGSGLVSACEAEKRFFSPVVPFHYLDGAIRFLKRTSLTVIHSMSGSRVGGGALTRWPPSASQTVRADFRHTAFTKTPPNEGEDQKKE